MARTLEPGMYFGTSVCVHDQAGLHVARTTYPSNMTIPAHEHENPFLCFVTQGAETRAWPSRAGASAPMHLTLFPANVPHSNDWSPAGGEALHVEFSRSWLERLGAHAKVLSNPLDVSSGAPLWLSGRLAAEAAQLDDASALSIEGLTLELLAACARSRDLPSSARAPSWLGAVVARLEENSEASWSLATLAEQAGISADHLSRVFRKHLGCTVGEFVRRSRIDRACEALMQDRLSLAEIAVAAGFADQSHFNRVFRRRLGCSPAQYREIHSPRRFHSKPPRRRPS